jgi:hypothetical protein
MPRKKNFKKEAWKWFSQYIRLKHSDINGMVKCVTCGDVLYWKDAQAGHFVDSRNNTVLLDDRLVFPQCCGCNIFLHGNKFHYTKFMLKMGYTMDELDAFQCLRFVVKKISQSEWQDKCEYYKSEVERLLKAKGIEL